MNQGIPTSCELACPSSQQAYPAPEKKEDDASGNNGATVAQLTTTVGHLTTMVVQLNAQNAAERDAANIKYQQLTTQLDRANDQIKQLTAQRGATTPQALVAERLQQNKSLYLKNVHSRQYLAAQEVRNHGPVTQQSHPTPLEFIPLSNEKSWYHLCPAGRRDLCFEVSGGDANGAMVRLSAPHTQHNQHFQLRKVVDNSGVGGVPDEYEIVVRSTGKVLDVLGFSMASGATVAQWDHTNTGNQKWYVTAPHPYF